MPRSCHGGGIKIVEAFQGMNVSPVKHSFAWPQKAWLPGQTLDKVIPMCPYASQASQQRTKNSGSIPRNACVACET